jgi:gp32 DNA binding protein like
MASPQRPSMRDRIKEQAKNSTTEGAGYLILDKRVTFFNPKAGDFELDFIPYENADGDLEAYRRFKVHSNIGIDDNKYVCPTSIGKPCPICDERKQMAKSKSGDSEIIKALNPKERMLFQCIDLLDKRDDSVQLYDASFHAFGKQLLKAIDTAENSTSSRKRSLPHAGFAELEGGQTLMVTMEESAKIKNFFNATRIDAENRAPYGDEILDDVLNLDNVLKILGYEELEAIFLELDASEQGSMRKKAEEEKAPAGRAGRTRGAAAEEEPPARSRTRGAAAEPAPATSRRRGAAAAEPELAPAPAVSSRRRGAAVEAPVEEVAPAGRRTRGAEPAAQDTRCWVPGGVFGKDCDTHVGELPENNCYDCAQETYTQCKAAQDAQTK